MVQHVKSNAFSYFRTVFSSEWTNPSLSRSAFEDVTPLQALLEL